jgi:hypothetical protein
VLIDLDSLPHQVPCLTPNWCRTLSEAAVFCLTSHQHTTNVRLLIESNVAGTPASAELCWSIPVTEALRNTCQNEPQTTDFGAMALALLITLNLTEYTEFQQSKIGTGFDYWLGKKDEFGFSARLEISGIRQKTSKNTVYSRLRIKQEQVSKSDYLGYPAYVIIIEFSEPGAAYMRKLAL